MYVNEFMVVAWKHFCSLGELGVGMRGWSTFPYMTLLNWPMINTEDLCLSKNSAGLVCLARLNPVPELKNKDSGLQVSTYWAVTHHLRAPVAYFQQRTINLRHKQTHSTDSCLASNKHLPTSNNLAFVTSLTSCSCFEFSTSLHHIMEVKWAMNVVSCWLYNWLKLFKHIHIINTSKGIVEVLWSKLHCGNSMVFFEVAWSLSGTVIF